MTTEEYLEKRKNEILNDADLIAKIHLLLG